MKNRLIPILMGVGLLGACLYGMVMQSRTMMKALKAGKEHAAAVRGEPVAPAPVVSVGRVIEAEKVLYKDPAGCVAVLEQVLAQPANEAELAAARSLMPKVQEVIFVKRLDDRQFDEAEALLGRMKQEYPDHERTTAMAWSWGLRLGMRVVDASRAGDAAALDAVFVKYVEARAFVPPKRGMTGDVQPFRQYADFKLKQWLALPAGGRFSPAGEPLLGQALSVALDWNGFAQSFLMPIKAEPSISGEDLFKAAGNFEAAQKGVQALNAYRVSRYLLEADRWAPGAKVEPKLLATTAVTVDWKLATLASDLAMKVYTQPGSVLTVLPAPVFLEDTLQTIQTPKYRTLVWRQALAIRGGEFLNTTAPLLACPVVKCCDDSLPYPELLKLSETLHECRNAMREVFEEGRRKVFEGMMQDPEAGVLESLDPALVAKARQRVSVKTGMDEQAAIRNELRRMVREGEAEVPVAVADDVKARQFEVLAREGAYNLASSREEAARALRVVLRQCPDAGLKDQVRLAVETRLQRVHKKGDFEALLELAALYRGEFGDAPETAGFRDTYRKILKSAATSFKKREDNKGVFFQAILAQAFADEETGRLAQAEAVRLALASVASVTVEQEGPDKSAVATAVPGLSSIAVDNSTEYHILVFYQGPETVAVICNPCRRGTFLLKNGDYEVAVLAPNGNIRPYHGRLTLRDEQRRSDYQVVQQASTGERFFSGINSFGTYSLLRAPKEAPAVKVDPASGLVTVPQ